MLTKRHFKELFRSIVPSINQAKVTLGHLTGTCEMQTLNHPNSIRLIHFFFARKFSWFPYSKKKKIFQKWSVIKSFSQIKWKHENQFPCLFFEDTFRVKAISCRKYWANINKNDFSTSKSSKANKWECYHFKIFKNYNSRP